ncbi:hypothetical protein Tco_0665887 [Tanacetum coccineum]
MHATCTIAEGWTNGMVNGKWKIVHPKVASFCDVYTNTYRIYISGVGDADYIQRVMYSIPFTLLHCLEVLKERDKWNNGEVPEFVKDKEEKSSKRYKSVARACSIRGCQEMELKKKELELKAAELKIRRLKKRQRDEAVYLSTTDEELNAILRQRLFY